MRTAVLTASYSKDFNRCRLLCESLDQRLKGDWTHYILVAGFDVDLFRALEGPRRRIINEHDLLPSWLQPVSDPVSLGKRKMWISPFGLPLRGWHVQQLRRMALCRAIDEPLMLTIDSDVVLMRDFDPQTLWQGDRLTFYRDEFAIDSTIRSNHLAWLAQSDKLLGIGPHTLPAHDYICPMVAWRTDTCRALLDYIETLHGKNWVRMMVRSRAFSECIIYGRYVSEVLGGAGHVMSGESLCHVMWFEDSFTHDMAGLRLFLGSMAPHHVGIGIQSFVGHDLNDIRSIVLEAAA